MKTASEIIIENYKKIIASKHPDKMEVWPILSGYDLLNGEYQNYIICIFKQTGNTAMMSSNVVMFTSDILGVTLINESNIDTVRESIRKKRFLKKEDSVVILKSDGSNLNTELYKLLFYHEIVMGIINMKLFLSHKGSDKDMIREYKKTLEEMGFDVWLDEDAMPAGTQLHKGILQGFKDSCAAIFFITPNYIDEGFLETEITYAIDEKMKKKELFSIITLVFEKDGKIGEVPELLRKYVWKQPKNDLQSIQEILKALPIKLSSPSFR